MKPHGSQVYSSPEFPPLYSYTDIFIGPFKQFNLIANTPGLFPYS